MAFTGTPVVTQISDRIVKITGVSLAALAEGTIGLHGTTGTPDIILPAHFQPAPYEYEGALIGLQDAISVFTRNVGAGGATAIPIDIYLTGTTVHDFLITIENTHSSLASTVQAIEVRFHE